MKFSIRHQEEYSRGELLLRSFFGIFYIMIPHGILMYLLAIGGMFVRFITFWAILITGKWPKGLFDYSVKLQRYGIRVMARMMNLSDGYPEFGLNGSDDKTLFDMEYPEEVSRLRLLGRAIFGIFLILPHVIVLYFRMIGVYFAVLIAWFAVLFTGKYPKGLFDFVVGTVRWGVRVGCYLSFYTDNYPPFSGKALPEEEQEITRESNPDLLDDVV